MEDAVRAVWLREFGGPEVLVVDTAPEPLAGPGQVLVDVEFANITFIDTMIRSGAPGPFRVTPPIIPGNGVGGVVAAVGPEVDPALVGRRVVASTGGSGGYAQRAAVAVGSLFEVPDGLALDAATAVLADGRTATWIADAAGLSAGDRVLVEAAAGGVGTLLVQLARAAGATVVAAAGGGRKLALAAGLGAQVTVDYRADDWPERVREAVGGLDVVLDGVGGAVGRAAFELLDAGGRMLTYGLSSGSWTTISDDAAAARGVTILRSRLDPADLRRYTLDALAAAAAGRLRPIIGQRVALDRAADAHAAIGARETVGKTLLLVGG
jgi:NADPH2:quinone reductase